jgi:predicted nucleic-acid-binding protein
VKVTADTNLLVRIVARYDAVQARVAFELLSKAERVMICLPCLCELVWVLRSVYGFGPSDLDTAVRVVTEPGNVMTDQPAVAAGLQMLARGGDFADGVIASTGMTMGAETFVSFDRKAVTRLGQIGISARHAGEFE